MIQSCWHTGLGGTKSEVEPSRFARWSVDCGGSWRSLSACHLVVVLGGQREPKGQDVLDLGRNRARPERSLLCIPASHLGSS